MPVSTNTIAQLKLGSWRSVETNMTVLVFITSLLLIAAMNWGRWDEIPYWDAAFSVFPAASALIQSDFDYQALLSAKTFLDGGPNVHANSSVTFLTAIVLKIMPNSSAAFVTLHWIHYLFAASAVTLLYAWSLPLLGRVGALLAGLATLVFPLFLTQAGHMYLEIPSACAFLFALFAFHSDRVLLASFWAFVAVSIKEPGIIVAGTLGVASLLKPISWKRRIGLAVIVVAPSVMVAFIHLSLHKTAPSFQEGSLSEFLSRLWSNLQVVPDLLALTLVSVLASIIYLITRLSGTERSAVGLSIVDARRELSYLAFGMFPSFYLCLVVMGWVFLLPRYFVQVVPLMILIVVDASMRIIGRRTTTVLLACFCLISIINTNGRFYPFAPGNNGSDAERSGEYVDLLAVHQDAMAAAEALPSQSPIFHGLPEHYFSQYPVMGYVKAPLKNAHCILLEPEYSLADLKTFPDHFYLLYSFGALGGDKLNWLKTQALANPEYSVSVSYFRRGHYQSQLIEVRRITKPFQPLSTSSD